MLNVKRFKYVPASVCFDSVFSDIGQIFSSGGLIPMLLEKKDKSSSPGSVTPPDPNTAVQTALNAQNLDRKKLLATGGKVDYTGGEAMILGSDIKTLNMGGM